MRLFVRIITTTCALTIATCVASVAAQDGVQTIVFSISDSIIHLPRGDSVELQSSGPLVVADQPRPGLMITFYPFLPLSDTGAVHSVALELFYQLRPHFTGNPPFVGMRAIDVRAAIRQQGGAYSMRTFGVMLVHNADGRWYEYGATIPISDR